MRISRLIRKLQKFKKEHGDINVCILNAGISNTTIVFDIGTVGEIEKSNLTEVRKWYDLDGDKLGEKVLFIY